jgi:hypothetical protein
VGDGLKKVFPFIEQREEPYELHHEVNSLIEEATGCKEVLVSGKLIEPFNEGVYLALEVYFAFGRFEGVAGLVGGGLRIHKTIFEI